MNKTTCRGCGAEIEWIKTKNGASMPVNPGYVEIDIAGAKIMTIVTDEGKVESGSPINRVTLFPPEMVAKGRISHFSTCPQASRYRKQ